LYIIFLSDIFIILELILVLIKFFETNKLLIGVKSVFTTCSSFKILSIEFFLSILNSLCCNDDLISSKNISNHVFLIFEKLGQFLD
jgi:hypothetical protein